MHRLDNDALAYLEDAPDGIEAIDLYFQELRGSRLLSAEQEIALANRVQAGLNAECDSRKQPTPELQLLIEDGALATSQLAFANTRLVISIAKQYRLGSDMTFLDLIQEGNIGLLTAIRKFDPTLGYRFSTYATWWIRQAVQRSIDNQGRAIRLPAHVAEKVRRMKRVSRELEAELQTMPSAEQVAARLQTDADKVSRLMNIGQETLSLNRPIGEDGTIELADTIADEQEDFADTLDRILSKQALEKMLTELEPREADILRLRYGLGTQPPCTLNDIGARFGLSRERIRQLESLALDKLRLTYQNTDSLHR